MPGSDEEKSDPVEDKAPASGKDQDKSMGNDDAQTSGAITKEGDKEPPPPTPPAADASAVPAANDPNSESNRVALNLQNVAHSTGTALPIGDPATLSQVKDKDEKKDEEKEKEASTTKPTEAAAAATSTAAAAETAVLAAAKASEDAKSASAKPAAKKKGSAMKRIGRASLVGKSNGDTAEEVPMAAAAAPALPPLDVNYEELTASSFFTTIDMRGNVADSFFVAIAQMRPCGLTQDDRVGKYRQREIGFVGMCCKHCGGTPGFGRYFPGSFDSFLNGKNCDGIVRHVALECLSVPTKVREVVVELEKRESQLPGRLRYGSRKRFFTEIWTKLRNAKVEDLDKQEVGQGIPSTVAVEGGGEGDVPQPKEDVATTHMWTELLKDCELVETTDRHLVSDILLGTLAQMKRTEVTENDRIGRCKNHPVGFVGMSCKHCGGKAGKPGFGRYFPSSIRSLAQVDSCQHMIKHVTGKCAEIPPEIREKLVALQDNQQRTKDTAANTSRSRYGSRKMFFRRVWSRLHGDGASDKADHAGGLPEAPVVLKSGTGEPGDAKPERKKEDTTDWEKVLDGSSLVTLDDQGLISPAQFAALAQMKKCQLTKTDQTGWYKDREIGFGGFCCRHCGGRPSFGRYFPNNVRSFAQTTSSHTVISHIAQCKDVPEAIQSAVLRLQQDERFLPESAVYGSRKIFYDRIWSRLHGIEDGEGEAVSAEAAGGPVKEEEKPVVEEAGPVEQAAGPVEESESNKNKRKDPPPGDADPTSQPEDKKPRTKEESVVQEV